MPASSRIPGTRDSEQARDPTVATGAGSSGRLSRTADAPGAPRPRRSARALGLLCVDRGVHPVRDGLLVGVGEDRQPEQRVGRSGIVGGGDDTGAAGDPAGAAEPLLHPASTSNPTTPTNDRAPPTRVGGRRTVMC